jgi:dolichol kinase
MKKIFRDFISVENRQYPVRIGKTVASSLTGFIVGAATAHLIWFSTVKEIFYLFNM